MPLYKYKILTIEGCKRDGYVFANDYKGAYNLLSAKKYRPIKIKKIYFVSQKVDLEDMLMFFLHIDFQLKCGVGINKAIESFVDFHGNQVLSASLVDVLNALKNGESVSDAFEKCSAVFDAVIIGLLKSAEKTGKTSDVIENVLNFLRLQADWKNNVKRAIGYPVFIAVVAVLVLILSVGMLGSQVASLVQNFGNGEMSTLTKFTIEVLPKIAETACCFIPVIILMFFLLLFSKKGRQILSNSLLKMPKIGALFVKISVWQFCKILQIALAAKLDFIHALNLAIGAIKFENIRKEFKKLHDFIVDGYKISESFSKIKFIDSGMIMAIYVGEDGNDLEKSFQHISDSQYKEMLFEIKSVGMRLSIGLTLFTGLIFVFILCSLFYPIYSYVEVAGT